jgi:carbamoyl-phosphate synthase large subunit
VQLFRYFKEAAKSLLPDAAVWVGDADPTWSAVCALTDLVVHLPKATAIDYPKELERFCVKHHIGLLIPTIDTELLVLAELRDDFEKLGIHIVISDTSLVSICNNKLNTIDYFLSLGIATPTLFTKATVSYPYFYKPIHGSSSQNIGKVPSAKYDFEALWEDTSLLKMAYLGNDYEEYSVDIYYDRNGRLQCAVPRLRVAVRDGEISKGCTVRNAVYDFVLKHFTILPGARGCVTLQLFYHPIENNFFGIEINPRFGGGYPLSHEAGALYVNWLLQEYLLEESIPFFDAWKFPLKLLRFDNHVVF